MPPRKKVRLSIVLPCYNEARGIRRLLDQYKEAGKGIRFELILVDNGSTDDTQSVLQDLLPEYPFARCVRIVQNQGYGHGIFTGLSEARGDILAWSHADLQTHPKDVFRSLRKFRKCGCPARLVVKGQRYGRAPGEWIISRGMEIVAMVLLRRFIGEINAQPKLFRRELMDELEDPPVDFNFDVYVLYKALQSGWRISSIPVRFPPREYGESNWSATWKSKLRTITKSIRFMARLGGGGVN